MSTTPEATPIAAVTSSVYPGEIDPILAAMADAIIKCPGAFSDPLEQARFAALGDLTEENVILVDDNDTETNWIERVDQAVAMTTGLCLLIVCGDPTNPDPAAPGPQLQVPMELQLYIKPQLRADGAAKPMAILAALIRLFHHAELRTANAPWLDEFAVTGWHDLEDPDLFAKAIDLTRNLSF